MYKVQNSLTYRSWEVDSRDDLLAELELLNARRNPLDPEENWDIFYLSEQGELLEKTSITFPFQATIDELLAGFGYAKPKTRQSFFSRIFGRRKQQQPLPEVAEEVGEEPAYEMPVVDEPHQDLDSLLEETALSAAEDNQEPVSQLSEGELEEVIRPDIKEEDLEEDSIVDHVATSEPEEEEKEVLEEESTPESTEISSYVTIPPSATTIVKVTGISDVESLSTSRLQSDMELTLTTEIEQIDALIARLQEQRKGHVQLLEYLQQFKLN